MIHRVMTEFGTHGFDTDQSLGLDWARFRPWISGTWVRGQSEVKVSRLWSPESWTNARCRTRVLGIPMNSDNGKHLSFQRRLNRNFWGSFLKGRMRDWGRFRYFQTHRISKRPRKSRCTLRRLFTLKPWTSGFQTLQFPPICGSRKEQQTYFNQ